MKTFYEYTEDPIFNSRAQAALSAARRIARELEHNYVGTEDLLVALAEKESGAAASVLRSFNINADSLAIQAKAICRPANKEQEDFSPDPLLAQALDQSIVEAQLLNHACVDTEDLLLGLLRVQEKNNAHILLEKHNVAPQKVVTAVLALFNDGLSSDSLVIRRNSDGVLIFSAGQMRQLLGRQTFNACELLDYRCQYHLNPDGTFVPDDDGAIFHIVYANKGKCWSKNPCKCGAKAGEFHEPGCEVEECPFCHRQLISCDCAEDKLGIDPAQEPAHSEGLSEEQQTEWDRILREKGLIPYGNEKFFQ